jgi:hypothetical protein
MLCWKFTRVHYRLCSIRDKQLVNGHRFEIMTYHLTNSHDFWRGTGLLIVGRVWGLILGASGPLRWWKNAKTESCFRSESNIFRAAVRHRPPRKTNPEAGERLSVDQHEQDCGHDADDLALHGFRKAPNNSSFSSLTMQIRRHISRPT